MTEVTLEKALELGVRAHKAGKLQEADRIYTAILEANPQHPDANHNMGVLAVSVGKIEQAIPFLEKALLANKRVEQFWVSLIEAHIKIKQIEKASELIVEAKNNKLNSTKLNELEIQLQKLVSNKSADSPVNILDRMTLSQAFSLAAKKLKTDEKLKAEEIYLNILQRFPKNQRARLELKKLKSKSTEIAIDPSDEVLSKLISLYQEGQSQQVLNQARLLLKDYPRSIMLWNISGVCNAALKNFDAAIGDYRNALKINHQNTEILYNLANAHLGKNDYPQAITHFKKAISLAPNNPAFHNNCAVALHKNDDLIEAEVYFSNAISIQPNHFEALNNAGKVYKDLGQPSKALEHFKKSINSNPKYAPAYNNLAMLQLSLGQTNEAIKNLNEAIKVDQMYVDALNNLGIILRDNNNLDSAIKYLTKAAKINTNAVTLSNLGVCYKEKREYAKARECYDNALRLDPSSPETYVNFALLQYDTGALRSSLESYFNALRISPLFSLIWDGAMFPILASGDRHYLRDALCKVTVKPEEKSTLNCLKSVLEYRLYEGSDDAINYFEKALDTFSSAGDFALRNPKIKAARNAIHNDLPIIALTHFGRSGTGLLHSLIDNHPEISTLPSVYFSEYFNPDTWQELCSGGWDNLIDHFIATYDVLFDARSAVPIKTKSGRFINNIGVQEGMANLGMSRDEVLTVDKTVFRKELKRILSSLETVNAFSFFQCVHTAYNNTISDTHKKQAIFYHIHNPSTHALLNLTRFSDDTKWVMMVREPVQCLESWVRQPFENLEHSKVINRIQLTLFELDNIIYTKRPSVGVKLEDLKTNPQKTIQALCEWMGIREEKSLYEMTAQGKKWWGDPSSPDFNNDGMDPFGKTSINRKVGSIFSKSDQYILRTLFYPFSVKFGYLDENEEKFIKDLETIRPMFDDMLDFEKTLADHLNIEYAAFKETGNYSLLRSVFLDRWTQLKKHKTYPNMLSPLPLLT